MHIPYNGVIDKTTGDLIRCGFSDFTNDGSFDPVTEEIRTDCPKPGKYKGISGEINMHRWNGTTWTEVIQP